MEPGLGDGTLGTVSRIRAVTNIKFVKTVASRCKTRPKC